VLVRFDPATGRFVPISHAHIRVAGLYKIVPKGASGTLLPAPSSPPTILPATGASPFGALLALAAALFVVGWGLVGWRRRCDRSRTDRNGRRSAGYWLLAAGGGRRAPARDQLGLALCAGAVLLAATAGLAYAYATRGPAPVGYGTLTDPGGPAPRSGGATGPPTRLVIARLGIATPVVPLGIAGGQWQVPAYTAGYLSGGAWPGHAGNAVITGHDDRDGAVFRRLSDLHRGDVVRVYAGARPYRYAVSALRVVPATRTDLVHPTQGAILTLITCTPYLIDTQRLVVRARLLP
jgi:LPXTG-site transpeptidase (sortase) family protein